MEGFTVERFKDDDSHSPRVRAWIHGSCQRLSWLLVVGLAVAVAAGGSPGGVAPGEAFAGELSAGELFERHVRPLLLGSCLKCHGPEKQENGLRLDGRESILRGGESGPAVVPGKPDESLLIQAVRYGGSIEMPPSGKLRENEISALTSWVKLGAPWPAGSPLSSAEARAEVWKHHWAAQTLGHRDVPETKDRTWPRTAIDRFVLSGLEEKGLTPARAADRRTLIRRATFDLLGLPPTPDEVRHFEEDPAPHAFSRVVDRLLASPHYGERWGRHWLDVARYADTKGYVLFEAKEYPFAYTYRDYVIDAFNRDLPYDDFVVQQLAADRVELGPDKGPLAAMGFLTVGQRFFNAPDIIDDRIDVVTRGFLGLTVACARCHDHKYDPIPTADYYSLYGVFASSMEPSVLPLLTPAPATEEYAKFEKEFAGRIQKLADFVHTKHVERVRRARTDVAEYLLAAQKAIDQPSTEDFMLLADEGDLNPDMVRRWRLYLQETRETRDPVFAPWHAFAALPPGAFATEAAELSAHLLAQSERGGAIHPIVSRALADHPPASVVDVAETYGEVLNEVARLWESGDGLPAVSLDAAQQELHRVFYGPRAPPDVPEPGLGPDLALFPDRKSQKVHQDLLKAVEEWQAKGPGAPPRAMVLVDRTTPVEPRVFQRGNPNRPGEAVPRQFLGALHGEKREPFREGSGRLDLARAIVDPRNPLTPRVIVNRVWMHHFGVPLVSTAGDFGLRSRPPVQLALLDDLARRFVEEGWGLKNLHRRIMLSSVYQQASEDRADCRAIDPENHLLWKMNRRRLEFESMRDTFLTVAGDLNPRLGGPPEDADGAARRRRTIYTTVDRLQLPNVFRTFDFPDPESITAQRSKTTVAPQALYLMNHRFVMECARGVLRRPEIAAEENPATRVARLYRLFFSRAPTASEVTIARDYLNSSSDSTRERAEPWARYVQALLMLNEFVYVD